MEYDDKITQSLVSLIDETIEEIDELKKSRFAATEVDISGPGDSLNPDGASANGKLGKEDKDDDDDEDKKIAQKEVDKHNEDKHDEPKDEDSAKKAVNREADPDPGFPHGKAEGAKKAEDEDEDCEKAVNREADPDPGFPHGKAEGAKKAEDEDEDEEKKKKEKKMEKQAGTELGAGAPAAGGMNTAMKSEQPDEKTEELFKSYIDSRVSPLEEKLQSIKELVEQIAEQPVPSKRLTASMAPLEKGDNEFVQPLSKSKVVSQLMELKKAGKEVDELEFTKIDLGADLGQIAQKYGLK